MKPAPAAPRVITPPQDPDSLGSWRYFRSRGSRCTWNADATRILAHRCSTLEHDHDEIEPCEIGLLDPDGRTFTALGATSAWSDADGARLQWLDDERVIFNARDDNDRLYATILTIRSAGRGTDRSALDHPIHTVSPAGTHALTLGFERLGAHRPARAIAALVDPHAANPAPRHSGVCSIDLRRGTRERLLTLGDLANWKASPLGEGRTHFVDDLSYSPGGTRVAIVHRFERADGRTHARLLTIDAAGAENPRLLYEGRIARHAWIDEHALIVNAAHDALDVVLDQEADNQAPGKPAHTLRPTGTHGVGSIVAQRTACGTLLIVVEGRADSGSPIHLTLLRASTPDLSDAHAFPIGRFLAPESELDPAHMDTEDRLDITDMRASIDPYGTRLCIDTRDGDASAIATIDITQASRCQRPDVAAQDRSRAALDSRGTDIGLLEEARAALGRVLRRSETARWRWGGVA